MNDDLTLSVRRQGVHVAYATSPSHALDILHSKQPASAATALDSGWAVVSLDTNQPLTVENLYSNSYPSALPDPSVKPS